MECYDHSVSDFFFLGYILVHFNLLSKNYEIKTWRCMDFLLKIKFYREI